MTAILYEEIRYEDQGDSYDNIAEAVKIDYSCRIEPYCVIDAGVEIGANTIIGPYNHIRTGTKIGNNCKIGGHNVFEGSKVIIGDNVRIGTHSNFAYGVEIEDLVFIAGHFTGANDRFMERNRKDDTHLSPYTIKKGARIGLGVIVLPGVVIGEYAFIGANSLVTKNVGAYEMWYGSPAEYKRKIQIERLNV